MTRDKIKEIIVDELSGVSGMAITDIKEENSLSNDLGLDSLDFVEIVIDLENAFGISIHDDEMDPMGDNSVKDLIDLIENKIS